VIYIASPYTHPDSNVVSISSSWSPDVAGGRIVVEVKRARARKQRDAGVPAARGLAG
jgi:hypothetical protein